MVKQDQLTSKVILTAIYIYLPCPRQKYFASGCQGTKSLYISKAESQMCCLVWIPQTLGSKPLTEIACGVSIHGDIQTKSVALLDHLHYLTLVFRGPFPPQQISDSLKENSCSLFLCPTSQHGGTDLFSRPKTLLNEEESIQIQLLITCKVGNRMGDLSWEREEASLMVP